jgi:signal transduction histidine kinase
VIEALCYALLVLAWIVDLFTPQLFVAAILLNGPIALSSLALQPRLTVQLTVLAEIANLIAGYVNGVQAGHHWDTIAVGDRVLTGASFILVAVLTMRAQQSARRAGEAAERERQIERERSLRLAMQQVRASLNMELVLRSAVREAERLTNAPRVAIIVRESSLGLPDTYEMRAGDDDVAMRRAPLPPELSSIIERARAAEDVVSINAEDPLGRLLGESAFVATLHADDTDAALFVGWGSRTPSVADRDAVKTFVENLTVALQQARLFIRLAEQNEQIGRQRDELEARSDIIRDIVYALAHDLRTPLAAADVTMRQALEGAYGDLPERYRSILNTTVGSNAELRRLVETLLLVARYESGEDSGTLQPEAVQPLVDQVVGELQPLAQQKGITLAQDRIEGEAVVEADVNELRRAIINLIANALDATPADGHVRARAERRDGRLRISVIDDGYGVPPERRSALFQRFGGVRSGGGTGLGLYIVRRIAEKHGGTAGYEPGTPSGSVFYIDLPLQAEKR